MTAPLPQGLIRVVSATQQEEPSDPAEVIYEHKQALHNFWKVHDAQSRTTQDASSIRCRQLFWRVWSDRRLSLSLSQNTMMQLWLRCQQDFDLSPFELRIESSSSSAFQSASSSSTQIAERIPSRESQLSSSTGSISPTQVVPGEGPVEEGFADAGKRRLRSRALIKTSEPRPGVSRTLSGESNRKRSIVTVGATRGRSRPSMTRKRSSQAGPSAHPVPSSENVKPRKSIIKSPRTSVEEQKLIDDKPDTGGPLFAQMRTIPIAAAEPSDRKISMFGLPSASSWQSIESHAEPSSNVSTSQPKSSLVIDRNFRERFQEQLRSSTNLAGMNKAMRKTGSVVRFADEVEGLRKLGGADRQKDISTPHPDDGESWHRAASEGQQPRPDPKNQGWSWRPNGIERHDSVGSVAAVSDDGFDTGDVAAPIPRTKSQLSMAIADLKRSQSLGEQEAETNFAVTSPQIEEEQDALISGKQGKKPSEEEEKLLAMGRKDGVTKAGGVNLPKELTVKGRFELPGDGYESPEEPLF